MGLIVRLSAQARSDLKSIRDYLLANADTQAANRVREHLRSRIQRLAERPLAGARTGRPDIRVLSPTRYPYRVYYTTTDKTVVILHIRHTARQSPDDGELGS